MADRSATARPRLRDDVHVIPTRRGARMVTALGAVDLTGPTVYHWLTALAPHLDGTAPLAGLTGPLPPDKQDMARRVVASLRQHGLVRDGSPPRPRRGETGYLDICVPDAEQAYRRYAAARVLAVGDGPLLAEAAGLLTASGAPAPAAVPADALKVALGAGADLVLYCPGHDPTEVLALCRHHGVPVAMAVPRGDDLWINAGTEGASGLRRLDRWKARGTVPTARVAAAVTDGPARQEQPPRFPAGAAPEAAALAAGLLGTAAFRLLTGAADDSEATTLTCLHVPSLGVSTHRFLPLPPRPAGPTAPGDLVRRVTALTAMPPLDLDALDAAGARLLDPRTGVIGEVTEGDYPQLPLNVAAATVAGRTRPATGTGVTVARAKWRAVLSAVAAHAVAAVDPARPAGGRVRAYRLADGSTQLVDAAEVFTGPDEEEEAVGAVCGLSWDAAVTAGLLAHCARLTAAAPGRPVRMDPAALARDRDGEARACLRMAAVLGLPLTVHDVTGELGVPTLAFGTGDRRLAYVSAPHPADALSEGLRAVLFDAQSPPSARPAPPTAPAAARTAVGAHSLAQVVGPLLAKGFDPLVVPLDHDPEVARVLPFTVRVVLRHG